jgi:uncharacterized protein (DUF433 family)
MTFEEWQTSRVVRDLEILAGEPIFRDSRLSVRHIGLRAGRDSHAEILEDYPYLDDDDVMFAAVYAKKNHHAD